jgi:exopolyphosphatase/guanosine-5'-triphosphate,3'-diphosphate pyrophosphatase
VFSVLDEYAEAIREFDCDRGVAVLTSAVRDAENGAEFLSRVRDDYRLDAQTLSGDEEARLTFLGATWGRKDTRDVLVVDIGGGSTELVLGTGVHTSTQIGVVRHSERHLHSDPPARDALDALAADVRAELPSGQARTGIAVAGTPTQCAAIELGLEPYDPARVEGHVLTTEGLRTLLARLAALPMAERGRVPGLDPARAPVIVAGIVILLEVFAAFGLDRIEASERDILWGVALDNAEIR